jgi:hypothetical protein
LCLAPATNLSYASCINEQPLARPGSALWTPPLQLALH